MFVSVLLKTPNHILQNDLIFQPVFSPENDSSWVIPILDSTLILMDILDNLVVITAFISSYDNVDLAVNMTYIMCISLEQQI